MNEENEEYSRYSGDGEVDDISNGATHLARLAHQAEMVGSAGLEAMEVLLAMQKEKIKVLQTRKAKLKQQLLLFEEVEEEEEMGAEARAAFAEADQLREQGNSHFRN